MSIKQKPSGFAEIELTDADHEWLWEKCILPLIAQEVIKPSDSATIIGALTWWSTWQKQRREFQASGSLDWKSYSAMSGSWKQFLVCIGKLGLSPKDRERLGNCSVGKGDANSKSKSG